MGGKLLVVCPQHILSNIELDIEDQKCQLNKYIEDKGEKEVIIGRIFKKFRIQ